MDLQNAEAALDKERLKTMTPTKAADLVLVAQQTEEAIDYVKRMRVLRNNLPKLYRLLWGQCTPGLQSELHGHSNYKTKSDTFDCLWLVTELKLTSSGFAHTANPFHSAFHALKGFSCLCQGSNESMDSFYNVSTLLWPLPSLPAAMQSHT
jgi:hypothetical protein